MNKYRLLERLEGLLSWFACIAIVVLLLGVSLSMAHGNGKTPVKANVSFVTCGTRMMYSNGGYGCVQEAKRIKAKKADNYQIRFTKIPRR